jgi:hypothetical protein
MTAEPYLFSAAPELLAEVAALGDPREVPAAIVVDWEQAGKPERQAASTSQIGIDTDLHADTHADLATARALTDLPIICRINAVGARTREEVQLAAELGAEEVLVPMVRCPAEVEAALDACDGRLALGIMVETADAVSAIGALAAFPLARAFVGLMDLAIDRGTPSVFSSLVDGTVERALQGLGPVPYGFGGMTVPHRGHPIPSRLLMGEIVRLGCSFSFLRRSFLRDVGPGGAGPAIAAIRDTVHDLAARSTTEVELDHKAFVERVERLEGRRP